MRTCRSHGWRSGERIGSAQREERLKTGLTLKRLVGRWWAGGSGCAPQGVAGERLRAGRPTAGMGTRDGRAGKRQTGGIHRTDEELGRQQLQGDNVHVHHSQEHLSIGALHATQRQTPHGSALAPTPQATRDRRRDRRRDRPVHTCHRSAMLAVACRLASGAQEKSIRSIAHSRHRLRHRLGVSARARGY